ncbi:Reversal of tor2 lethality [Tilletia horrida]|uniref:Protein ROT1 n=1 Tax=Tilletia horrida TaxID=155126 RepID=A0AAN6JNJ3_9BASI|nr:Reversal of tor2 lethality [Tilletia horrida]KAK0528642.1 Reversal of tor2 lethality [Tilletia horrida]KAK0555299.1 Reversal of tor2 lethality [Tilletia horrida]
MLSSLRTISTGAAAALFGASLLLLGSPVQAQNTVDIVGTWSSGAGNVVTGLQFFNPTNNSFIPPKTAGRSYSFTSDGHWEQAIFQYIPNPAQPNCITAQLIWQHGTYTRNSNGSLSLTPFKGDGHQQIKSMCGQISQFVQYYEEPELISKWETSLVRHYGSPAYALQLYAFDGTPVPVLYQIYNPPQMLPTQQLHQQIIGKPYKK